MATTKENPDDQSPATNITGIEFGSLPENPDIKEITDGTIAFLLELRTLVADELRGLPLDGNQKRQVEQSLTTFSLFIHNLIGLDPFSTRRTKLNPKALDITLQDLPENVFQAWQHLCHTVPSARNLILIDPKKDPDSDTFKKGYHLPYLIFQKALRKMVDPSATKIPGKERTMALLDNSITAKKSDIDKSKPFAVNPEDINRDRIKISTQNLLDLLERRKDDLPNEVNDDISLLQKFLNAILEEDLGARTSDSDMPKDEKEFFNAMRDSWENPSLLNLSIIPSKIIEAMARLSLADAELHLAFIGHDFNNISSILDAAGHHVSTVERRYAYHPLALAALSTSQRDESGLATIHELYRLDDITVVSAGAGSNAIEVTSAAAYGKIANVVKGPNSPLAERPATGFLGRVWAVLNAPIGELLGGRRKSAREVRNEIQINRWLRDIPKIKALLTQGSDEAARQVETILSSMHQEPSLMNIGLLRKLVDMIIAAAREASPDIPQELDWLTPEAISLGINTSSITNLLFNIAYINRQIVILKNLPSKASSYREKLQEVSEFSSNKVSDRYELSWTTLRDSFLEIMAEEGHADADLDEFKKGYAASTDKGEFFIGYSKKLTQNDEYWTALEPAVPCAEIRKYLNEFAASPDSLTELTLYRVGNKLADMYTILISEESNTLMSEIEATSDKATILNILKKYFEIIFQKIDAVLGTFESAFESKPYIHGGFKWEHIKPVIEKNPEAIHTIDLMQLAGHEPNIFNSGDKAFYIATCSEDSPESSRNCVYDKAAEDRLRDGDPLAEFNGNAQEMAAKMGLKLIDPAQYYRLQELGKYKLFDKNSSNWLLKKPYSLSDPNEFDIFNIENAPDDHESDAFALSVTLPKPSYRPEGSFLPKESHDPKRGWRGVFKVMW
ncbi:MAG: DUF4256 domain-containing protein [Patescibacteria group bacterium]